MELRKRNLVTKVFKYLVQVTVFIISSLIYCEYLHYYLVLSQCHWPNLKTTVGQNDELRIVTIADTHLLGKKNGHWFDKLRREWQMHRSFQTTMDLHGADVVIFLGDLFDEGKWCSSKEFTTYIQRFGSLFHVSPPTEILLTAGNHDMGFHYSIHPNLADRFENAFKIPLVHMKTIKGITFVSVNSMAMHGDECFLCKPARLQVENISKKLRCSYGYKDDCVNNVIPPEHYSSPILLQHYPMYRESDAACSEPDEAPLNEKYMKFREKWECLSKESSNMLLRELQPRLVLSGHTHHGCQTWHNISIKSPNNEVKVKKVLELTIPSYSWRNKKNPTFSMITASKEDYEIYKCHMPNENTIQSLYILFILLYILYMMKKKFRMSNFFYNKYYKEK